MKQIINGKEYTLVTAFQENAAARQRFNALAQRVYGFDFEQWYRDGYWGRGYIPCCLMADGRACANVSISVMDFSLFGQKKRYIQIGTVMTDPEYRGQGLSRFLMERVIAQWKPKSDLIFLFANDSVLDFYPKFGFTPAREYRHGIEVRVHGDPADVQRLDMSQPENRRLLTDRVSRSVNLSPLSLLQNAGLVMFYATSSMREDIYYIKSLDAAIFARYSGDTLRLDAVFSPAPVSVERIIGALAVPATRKAILGFTPSDPGGFRADLLKEEDTTLFVMGDSPFGRDRLMFPVLSHT